MKLTTHKPSPIRTCLGCGLVERRPFQFEGMFCTPCSENFREGRDNTTRAVKLQQTTQRGQAKAARAKFNGGEVDEALEYSNVAGELFAQDSLDVVLMPVRGAGGEVVPQHDFELRDTLATPNAAALDASTHRLDLVTRIGTDVAAMALDTADTIGASNSVERMYSHQMAVLHSTFMEMVSKSTMEDDPVLSIRWMNLAIRVSEAFQRGAINFRKLRGGNQQLMRIEHVHIAPGAQAIVGPVQTGRALT